ncbi:MAG: sigma-70 family RNA polymerase sigma factor [Planctomycetota bacterium]
MTSFAFSWRRSVHGAGKQAAGHSHPPPHVPRAADAHKSSAAQREADLEMVRGCLAGQSDMVARLGEALGCVEGMLALRNRRLGGLLAAADLEDVAQEVRVVAWRRLSDYRNVAAFTTWVYGICEFTLRNHVRAKSRRRIVALEQAADCEAEPQAEPEFHDDVHDCMERLVTVDQRIVRAKHFEGVSLEQAAEDMDMNSNTLKSRYLRALRRLRDCLVQKGVVLTVEVDQ